MKNIVSNHDGRFIEFIEGLEASGWMIDSASENAENSAALFVRVVNELLKKHGSVAVVVAPCASRAKHEELVKGLEDGATVAV